MAYRIGGSWLKPPSCGALERQSARAPQRSRALALARSNSSRWMPAGIGPQLTADGGVGNQKTNRVGNLLGANQPAQLRIWQNVLGDMLLAQSTHHGRIGEARVHDAPA